MGSVQQRRRAIHIRHRTRGCAGWRHKCLIRPTSPFAGSNSVGPRKRSDAGRYTSDTVPAVVPDGGINALSGLRVPHRLNSVGPRKRSAAGRYTSDAVPAVVPDGGINALSGLRVLCWFKQRRPAQAQRRRAIHIRHRTRGCAGWRHKCLIRPAGPPQVQTA